jgi:hypothetical protein
MIPKVFYVNEIVQTPVGIGRVVGQVNRRGQAGLVIVSHARSDIRDRKPIPHEIISFLAWSPGEIEEIKQ